MRPITTELLREIGADDAKQVWFAERFPSGATWGEVIAALRADGQDDWVSWLTWYCPGNVLGAPDWSGRVALQEDVMDCAWLAQFCSPDVPGAPDYNGRLAMQMDNYDRAELARTCPPDVPGAPDYNGRLAMQMDDYDRAWFVLLCPPGVPGAPDWAGRLAVLPNDFFRASFALHCSPGVPGATLSARLAMPMSNEMREVVLRKFGGKSETDLS
jgi:hypothetical protein